jgi:hypothetical protein
MTLDTIKTILDYGKKVVEYFTGRKTEKIKKQVKEVLDEARKTRSLDRANRRISK